ncbi:MAG: TIGR00341 family protein [Parvibaculum sp.]|uniref:TIGR00341 family protein n=1 Tax=Parvibaculum sp. TaxID=2024848 RepID=UPI00272606E5|nr:TIGR00341 family protein [Parvibaculum sp.]MDO8839888.1 TIGR00341 family protein [Parvibaculum sp.]
MSLRVIEITAPAGYADTLTALAEQHEMIDVFSARSADMDGSRCIVRVVCDMNCVQAYTDAVQTAIGRGEAWRAVTFKVEGTVPDYEPDTAGNKPAFDTGAASREEIHEEVARNSELDSTYLILTALSGVVAAIGLLNNNVAVIIGAMVIAPLLGPNLAFALGTALGNHALMLKSMMTNVIGIGLTIVLGVVIAFLWTEDFDAPELLSRTRVGYDGIALALASGAAAVLSLVSGLSSALVGVMVAVALLPPAIAIGLMLGAGNFDAAFGAATLLGVNIVCINLAAQTVFVVKGIRPRTWWEKKTSTASLGINFGMWLVLLVALVGAIAWLKVPVVPFHLIERVTEAAESTVAP